MKASAQAISEPSVKAELASLYAKHGGLNPATVVEWAKQNPRSALHARFEWDDSEAAQKFRLWQARTFITEVTVTYPSKGQRQAYVSLVGLRGRGKASYMSIVDVMGDQDLRASLLTQALTEYECLGTKYRGLKALAGVRAAVQRVRR